MGSSIVVEQTTVGTVVDWVGPQPSWLPGSASCHGCQSAHGWAWVLGQLAVQLEGPRLVPACWWVGKLLLL